MSSSVLLGIVGMWFDLDHMWARAFVGICVHVFVGCTALMLRSHPPPC